MRTFAKVIIGINVLFLIWILVGAGGNADNCDGLSGEDLEICEAGTAIGTGIGVALICGLWFFVDAILGILFLITQPKPEPVVIYADKPPNNT